MRYLSSGPDARAGCEREPRRLGDLLERKRVELRREFALEPGLVALARMLARPAAIAAVRVADRLAPRSVHDGAASRIVAGRGLRCEHFASRFHRTEPMLAPRFRQARIAMPAPSLEHRLA